MRRLLPLLLLAPLLLASYQPVVPTQAGNTVYVDAVFGNDMTCARQGAPCKTPETGIAKALSGDVVLFRPGTYVLVAASGVGLTVPDGVVLEGTGQRSTTLVMNATNSATLMKFAAGTASITVRDIGLTLNGTGAHTYVGVEWDSTRTASASVRRCTITVNALDAGAPTAYGLYSSGTGAPAKTFYALNNASIVVNGAGTGTYRGVFAASTGELRSKITNLGVYGSGNGNYRGIETTATSIVEWQGGGTYGYTSGGAAYSDVLQTAGTIELSAGAYLEGGTAGGKSFTAYPAAPMFIFGDDGAITNGQRYMYPGTGTSNTTQISLDVPAGRVAFRLTTTVRTPPGGTDTCKVSLWTKRGIGAWTETALAVTLTGAQTTGTAVNISVDLQAGDLFSMGVNDTGATADLTAEMAVY